MATAFRIVPTHWRRGAGFSRMGRSRAAKRTNATRGCGYADVMSGYETPPPEDADRTITDFEEDVDPEAPADSPVVHPPQVDADRPVTPVEEDPDDLFQEENADTALDQPSEESS